VNSIEYINIFFYICFLQDKVVALIHSGVPLLSHQQQMLTNTNAENPWKVEAATIENCVAGILGYLTCNNNKYKREACKAQGIGKLVELLSNCASTLPPRTSFALRQSR